MSETYSIQLVVNSGDQSYDISSYVDSIGIVHSTKSVEPIFNISIQVVILRSINFNISSAELAIFVYGFSNTLLNNYIFNLIPVSYNADSFANTQSQYPDQSTMTLTFRSQLCFNALSYQVPTTILLNSNLNNLLTQIAPNNVNYILTPNLNNNTFEQLFVPSQSFLGALNYIKKWFSYYPGATSITIYPSSSGSANLLIRDNNYLSKNQMSDIVIYNVLTMQSDTDYASQLQSEYTDPNSNVYVTPIPVLSISNVPNKVITSNYNITTIPRASLSTNTSLNIQDFINSYAIVSGSFNATNENSINVINNSVQLINHYVGYDTSISSFTSEKGMELSNMVKTIVTLNLPPKIGIWAGMLFNLVINDPVTSSYAGMYFVNTVTYSLTSTETVTWNCNVAIEGIRANLNVS
ncbi:MAG: hypothetical protein QW478_08545 [Candidatus Micrarchaeaceae archaeon]